MLKTKQEQISGVRNHTWPYSLVFIRKNIEFLQYLLWLHDKKDIPSDFYIDVFTDDIIDTTEIK